MNWSNSWNNSVKEVENQQQRSIQEANNLINPEPSAFLEWDNKSKDDVLVEWDKRKKALEQAKADEMEFRKYVVKRAFPNPTEGTNTIELGNGYELKANIKFNYNLADNDIVEKTLEKIAKIGNQGTFIADRLVSWTPNFLLTEYRQLQEEMKKGSIEATQIIKLISEMLIVKDAAPSLNIKEPKAKKK